jgi:hypothetical protein
MKSSQLACPPLSCGQAYFRGSKSTSVRIFVLPIKELQGRLQTPQPPPNLHQALLLTPGLILGRFPIGYDTPTRPINLIIGAGYQIAVTANPVTQNNFVGTFRITF